MKKEKIKMFPSIIRAEHMIYEEKIDGSNFCMWITEDGVRYFSRNYEINLSEEGLDKTFKRTMIFLDEQLLKVSGKAREYLNGKQLFFETLGMANLKYQLGEEVRDQVYLIDVRNTSAEVWSTREIRENISKTLDVNIAPLIPLEELHNTISRLDGKTEWEGYIMKNDVPTNNNNNVKFISLKFTEDKHNGGFKNTGQSDEKKIASLIMNTERIIATQKQKLYELKRDVNKEEFAEKRNGFLKGIEMLPIATKKATLKLEALKEEMKGIQDEKNNSK